MSHLSRTILIGRMTRDPETRTTAAGKSVAEFVLAVDKRFKPKNPNEPTADFFRCKAWGNQCDFVSRHLSKGRLVAVEGRMESRKFVDKDGNNREVWELICDNVNSLDRPRDEQRQEQDAGTRPDGRPVGPGGPAPSQDEYDPFSEE